MRVAVEARRRRWTARRPAGRSASRCRPARSRPRRRRSNGPRRHRPVVARGVDGGAQARSAPRPSAAVSRERSARRTTDGPVGERGQHQRPVGQRLAAGQRDDGVDRARSPAARARVGGSHPRTLPSAQVTLWPWPRRASRRGGAGEVAGPRAARRVAARRARHATPGLPSVSPAAMIRPPSIETFLKKWIRCWLRLGCRVRSSQKRCPASVVGTSEAARTVDGEPRRPAGGQRRGRRRSGRRALMRTRVTGSVGIGSLGDGLLRPAGRACRRRAGPWRRGRGVLEGVDAADDEHRGEHRAGDQSGDGHGSFLHDPPGRGSGDLSGHRAGGVP